MWRLRLKLPSKNQFLGSMAIKHRVSMTGYPLSYWKDSKHLYLMSAGFIFGEEENKTALIKEVRNHPECVEFESEGDFIISVTKQPLFSEPVYDAKIIRPNPVIINKAGHHIWDLASFNREVLERVIDFAEKYLDAELLTFKSERIKNISFTKLLPELTDNQKKAMDIAINSGYYDYPKKVTLPELAKKMKISYSTFQAHLKKAEGKVLPLVLKEL